MMLNPQHLDKIDENPREERELIERCHIYAICQRSSICVLPGSVKHNEHGTTGILSVNESGKNRKVQFELAGTAALELSRVSETKFPYKNLAGYDSADHEVFLAPVNLLLPRMNLSDRSICDLDVLYFGQSFGDGSRSAPDRLANHETLQKILAHAVAHHPDKEILLLLFEYMPYRLVSYMDGLSGTAPLPDDQDSERFSRAFHDTLDEKVQICLAEAGLIRYFQPEYNIKLKKNFPSEKMKMLEKCYDIDFSGLVVEIDTEDIGCCLYSKERPKGYHHIAQFDLHDPLKRRSFFAMIDGDGKETVLSESGPMF